jgi:hypothetical protein
MPGSKYGDDLLGDGQFGGLTQIERRRDCSRDLRNLGERRQRHQGNAVVKLGVKRGGDLQGKPRFPHAARTNERKQADIRLAQQCGQRREFRFAADEGCQRHGKGRGAIRPPRDGA